MTENERVEQEIKTQIAIAFRVKLEELIRGGYQLPFLCVWMARDGAVTIVRMSAGKDGLVNTETVFEAATHDGVIALPVTIAITDARGEFVSMRFAEGGDNPIEQPS